VNPLLLFGTFIVLGAIWTAICGWVFATARHPVAQSQVEPRTAILRRRVLYVSSVLVLAIFVASLYWLPYVFVRRQTIGRPTLQVRVVAEQWVWVFSRDKVPAGVPVEFDVTSKDVNHGFGLYNPEGRLVAQTQAMPGYTNRLIFTFQSAGNIPGPLSRALRRAAFRDAVADHGHTLKHQPIKEKLGPMNKDIELTRLALLHMITGFVMFLAMGLLGLTLRLDQAGFWVLDRGVFYAIMTLHGAGMRIPGEVARESEMMSPTNPI
jgi:cytochrome c oxidase subunit II